MCVHTVPYYLLNASPTSDPVDDCDGYPPAVKPLGRIVIIQQYRGLHVHSCGTVPLCCVAGRRYILADVVAAHVHFPSLFTDHYLMTTMDSCTKLIVKCFIQHC